MKVLGIFIALLRVSLAAILPHHARSSTRDGARRLDCPVPDAAFLETNKQLALMEQHQHGDFNSELSVHVDTWFHIVAPSERPEDGWVSKESLVQQIDVLNMAFSKAGFNFMLQDSTYTIDDNQDDWKDHTWNAKMQKGLRRGDYATLNLWIVSLLTPSVAGYCGAPSNTSGKNSLDGCVFVWDTLPPHGSGNVLVHEVGHWLGLLHTFNECSEPGCTPECGQEGHNDGIDDTPEHLRPTGDDYWKCLDNSTWKSSTCYPNNSLDPVHNYMNYVPDECMKTFTSQQVERMRSWWNIRSGIALQEKHNMLPAPVATSTSTPTPQPIPTPTPNPTSAPVPDPPAPVNPALGCGFQPDEAFLSSSEKLRRMSDLETAIQHEQEITLDVIIHIIESSTRYDVENDKGLDSFYRQIDVLNDAYANSSTGIKFKHIGISRVVYSAGTGLQTRETRPQTIAEMAAGRRAGGYSTLNLYFVADTVPGTYGTCTHPSEHPDKDHNNDGCIINWNTLPDAQGHGGLVAVHEVGHWLGLLHTFQHNTTTGPATCTNGHGDFIEDTPVHLQPTADDVSKCDGKEVLDTCPELPGRDPVNNYMNYMNYHCQKNFTGGQGQRMRRWASIRQGIDAKHNKNKAAGASTVASRSANSTLLTLPVDKRNDAHSPCLFQPSESFLATSEALASQKQKGSTAFESATINVYITMIVASLNLEDGYLDYPTVTEQMTVLNNAYRGSGFEFRLMGLWVCISEEWATLEHTSVQPYSLKLRQGSYTDLNIWTVKSMPGAVGFAPSPEAHPGNQIVHDGVTVTYSTFPSDIVIHEVGHWLGLLHTFQEGAEHLDCITGHGDFVEDTPVHMMPKFFQRSNCNGYLDTCFMQRGADPKHNYMNYMDSKCMFEFTEGQKLRMQQFWVLRQTVAANGGV